MPATQFIPRSSTFIMRNVVIVLFLWWLQGREKKQILTREQFPQFISCLQFY